MTNINKQIFINVGKKYGYEYENIETQNWTLWRNINESMNGVVKEYRDENKALKKIIADDTDYKAMTAYAKKLERKIKRLEKLIR